MTEDKKPVFFRYEWLGHLTVEVTENYWRKWIETDGPSVVLKDSFPLGAEVRTTFFGVSGMVFETRVWGGKFDSFHLRADTRADAEKNHLFYVAEMRVEAGLKDLDDIVLGRQGAPWDI